MKRINTNKDNNVGWIKLHRSFLSWEWFDDASMVKLFVYFLIKANLEPKKWQGIVIKRGQFITSIAKISTETKLSAQTIRTCISRLKSTNEITSVSTSKYTMITICNYDSYQCQEEATNQPTNQPTNQRLTSNQPATNQQLTTTKEYKEYKNNISFPFNKEKDIYTSVEFSNFQKWILGNAPSVAKMSEPFTQSQFEKVKAEFHTQNEIMPTLLEMHNWKKLTTSKKSAYLTFLSWAKKSREAKTQKTQKNGKLTQPHDKEVIGVQNYTDRL